ncbi:LLM class flavin-dependent oxidoreductase [Janibacter sp. GS2]|uniref:LLM class flavin-dependent oxidoreductase n=1 Tax=Janibacter sp. GS2 TaxID=3442646 RepID=UPI003EBB7537
MSKRMIINGFSQNAAAEHSFGQWKDDGDRHRDYKSPDYWIRLAQLLESGCFDAMMFADVHGLYDKYEDKAEHPVRHAVQFPGNDPTVLAPMLAQATDHIGIICTYSTTFFSPFHAAKLFSSLDHYTYGRIGWNIVTGYLDSAYRNGLGERLEHDERYDRADEYMDVVYQLWENSWDEDAVVFDHATNTHTDPAKVYKIQHSGKYFQVEGPHMCEPSPQRTPFLVQAGGSSRGTAFAGRHAEAVFTVNTSTVTGAATSKRIREAAAKEGRDPESIKILAAITTVVDETDEAARAKFERYQANGEVDGTLALFGGWTGVDLAGFAPEDKMAAFESQGMQHIAGMFGSIDDERDWTFEEMCEYMKVSSLMPVLVGSPQTVANELERWMDEADIDGFNLISVQSPADFEDFVELVVPELQRRGRMRTSYDDEGPTLRELVSGPGEKRLSEDHPMRRIVDTYSREPISG